MSMMSAFAHRFQSKLNNPSTARTTRAEKEKQHGH
jgi:hypothetical protein